MATIIGLPKLSPTMEEGVLAKWHRKEGDKISPGDIIAEVETDKANMDFPLEDEGTLLRLLVKEGDTVKLGAPVAILGEEGEDVEALVAKAGQGQAKEQPAATSTPPAAAAKSTPPAAAAARSTPPAAPEPPAPPKPAPERDGDRKPGILASPIAKTLAAENGIDLRRVKGTGPGGRIVERDIKALLEKPQVSEPEPAPEPAPAPVSAPPPPRRAPPPPAAPTAEGEEFTDKSLSLMRKTIARRLLESKQQVPHFYLTAECDAGPLVEFRAALNRLVDEDAKISVNDLIIKASALALRKVPAANASFLGDRIRTHGRVHIGVAVAMEEGLITPVVRDVDQKGLRQLAAEIRDLATRARARKLTAEELSGGTFTVSNLGMFGIDHFEAIINPPEGAILAVGAIRKQPVVVSDAQGERLAIGQRVALTLSCDHRVIDGALGARFLQALVQVLENPAGLAL